MKCVMSRQSMVRSGQCVRIKTSKKENIVDIEAQIHYDSEKT